MNPTIAAIASVVLLVSTVVRSGEAELLLQAIAKQRAALNNLAGRYHVVARVEGRAPRVTKGSFLRAGERTRYEYTLDGRKFAYALDGTVTSSLRTEDYTGRWLGERRLDASGNASGIGRPDTDPVALMLTAFDEPLARYEFNDRMEDMRFANPAVGNTEVFKILITGVEGDLVKAETVTMQSSQLPLSTPRAFAKVRFTFDRAKGYAPVSKEVVFASESLNETLVVKEWALLNGVWLPVRLERTCYHYQREEVRTREEISFSDVTVPTVVDEDQFRLQFPPLTQVTGDVIRTSHGPDKGRLSESPSIDALLGDERTGHGEGQGEKE